jgi:hypothetical protein
MELYGSPYKQPLKIQKKKEMSSNRVSFAERNVILNE